MEHIYQHFRKEEQPFIEQVIGWQREVEERYYPKRTDFLNPRERFIVRAIIQQTESNVYSDGGFEQAERKRMLLYPPYYEASIEDLGVQLFRVEYAMKFATLTHPQVLGSLLANGLVRSRFGDIRIKGQEIQLAVAGEIADYIQMQLTQMNKTKVQLQTISHKEAIPQDITAWQIQVITVSAMRLDAILATILKLSRQKAQQLIQAGRVQVNFTVRDDRSFEIQEQDLLSIRQYGRYKIVAIEGTTRKDKIRLQVGFMA